MNLQEFDFDIKYVKGNENVIADAISRPILLTEAHPLISDEEILKAQKTDDEINDVKECIKRNCWFIKKSPIGSSIRKYG